jgi:excisionase family DNA binding protein
MRVFVTTEIAAELFGVSTQTIRNWIKEGALRTAPSIGTRREIHRIYLASVAERAGLEVAEVDRLVTAIESRQTEDRAINKTGALLAA